MPEVIASQPAMPLQNRVDPVGNFIRTVARGTMMGNRGGALHSEDRKSCAATKTGAGSRAFWNFGTASHGDVSASVDC